LEQDAVDARCVVTCSRAWTNGAIAYGEVVWSWRPVAGVQVGDDASASRWRRWQQSPVAGESTKETVKPSRRECRLRPVNLWHHPGIFCPNHGCIGHPAFPAPSFEGRAAPSFEGRRALSLRGVTCKTRAKCAARMPTYIQSSSPRRRGPWYSRALMMESRSCSVLDTRFRGY